MIQNNFYASIRKTTKTKVTEESFALPPDLGAFEEYRVSDYYCPDDWDKNGVFITAEEGEPLWIDLRRNKCCACIVSVQKINPITGEKTNLDNGLTKNPTQNYLKLPEQKWIDGYVKDGKVYQFTITEQDSEFSVSDQILDVTETKSQAIGIAFFGTKNPVPEQNIDYSYNYPYVNKPEDIFLGRKKHDIWANNPNTAYINYNTLKSKSILRGSILESQEIICTDNSVYRSSSRNISDDNNPDYSVETMSINDVNIKKASMGAGGRIKQSITSDENSPDFYTEKPSCIMTFYMCLPEQFKLIMSLGRRDQVKKDKYKMSGEIGGKQIPLMA